VPNISGPYMNLDMPPIHRVWGSAEKWSRWGWCNLSLMASHINSHYGTSWDAPELISRFGLEKQTAMRVKKFGLRILEAHNPTMHNDSIYAEFKLREYGLELLTEYQNKKDQLPGLFAPAGWAKDVMWALSNGGRRLIMDKDPSDPMGNRKMVVVAYEDGSGIYYF